MSSELIEYGLWTLMKDGRRMEARTRIVAGRIELRIYMSGAEAGERELWSSMTFMDESQVGKIAMARRHELESQGWVTP